MKRYYSTYFDKNYLIKGLGLIESLNRHENNDFQIFVVCLDELTRTILNKLDIPNVKTIPLHEIEQRDSPLLEAKRNRSLVEYYWTLTATVILRILERHPEIEVLTYLDADLFFYSSPDPIFDELGDQSILIHEHRFLPSQAHLEAYGKYNVGLLCFRSDSNGVEALKWWRDRCIEWCYARCEDGKYADQLYLDDWPTRFKQVVVLQNIGAGVGPWNHIQYSFGKDSGDYKVLVNNIPLVFYHFHSLAFVGAQVVIPSKYITNPLTKDILRLCFVPYLDTLSELLGGVRAVLPDFDFGVKHEAVIDYRHTFLARGEMRPQLVRSAISQVKIPLDSDWDCYCSEQLLEFSSHIDKINGMLEGRETVTALSAVMDAMKEFPDAPHLLALQAELEYDGKERVKALEGLLKSYPNCARAHSSLGLLYQNKGNKDKALYHYEKAAGLEPQNIIYQKMLADFYYVVSEQTEEALQLYLKIFIINPAYIENLLMLGHICVSLKKFDESKIFYKRVMELEPWNMDAREKLDVLGEGQRTPWLNPLRGTPEGAIQQGRETGGQRSGNGYQRAEVGDQRSSGMRVESAEKMYQDAQELIKSGEENEGISTLEKLLTTYPDYAIAHNDLGVLYYRDGNKEKSLQHYEMAAQIDLENPIFQKNLADFYYVESGRMGEAMEIYVKILASNPTDIETLIIMGQICMSLKKFEDAKVFYGRVLELEPWNVDARERLDELGKGDQKAEGGGRKKGDGWMGGRVDEGTEDGGQGVQDGWMDGGLDERTEDGGQESGIGEEEAHGADFVVTAEKMYQDAEELIKSGKENEGISALESLLEAYPDYAIAHNDLGVLCYNQGNKDEALHHYEKAAQLEPYNDTFQKNLADFYYVEAGRMEEALQIYVKLLDANPTDLEILLILGQICVSLKKTDDARVFFNKVLELEPWNMDARERIDLLPKG